MGLFGNVFIKYLALGFGALLVGMQIGYTIHYTATSGQSDVHRDAYEYMMALHDLQDEGLISDSDLKFLVAKHRQEAAGSAGVVQHSIVERSAVPTALQSLRTGVVQQGKKQVAATKVHAPVEKYGLCDGGDPKDKKLVFIKVSALELICAVVPPQTDLHVVHLDP